MKIQEGDAHNIFCPAYECYQLVPVHVIQSVVSREMDERYLHFDIKVKKLHITQPIIQEFGIHTSVYALCYFSYFIVIYTLSVFSVS